MIHSIIQVTYRVVQVGGDENNQQATLSIVTTNGILNTLSQEDGNSGGQQVNSICKIEELNQFIQSGNLYGLACCY